MQKNLYKIRFETEGFKEFTLNALWRTGVCVSRIKCRGNALRFSVYDSDSARVKAALERAGIKYSVVGAQGFIPKAREFFTRYFLIAGIAVSLAATALYSSFTGEITVSGAERTDPRKIAEIVEESLPSPFVFGMKDFSAIERKIMSVDGVAYASVVKQGRHIVVEIVEELPLVDITDTQTPLPLAANEDGEIVRIVVLRGTAAVKTGDKIKAGQVLIEPFVKDAEGNARAVRAMGIVEAKVRRTETWEYASEEEFNANAAEEVLRRKQAFETTLTEDEKFIGYSFDVKKLDKSVQISIYYDIITRVA